MLAQPFGSYGRMHYPGCGVEGGSLSLSGMFQPSRIPGRNMDIGDARMIENFNQAQEVASKKEVVVFPRGRWYCQSGWSSYLLSVLGMLSKTIPMGLR